MPRIAHRLARVTIARVFAYAVEGELVQLGVQPIGDGRFVANIVEIDQSAVIDLGHPRSEVVDRLGNVGGKLLPAAFAQQLESSLPVNLLRIQLTNYPTTKISY